MDLRIPSAERSPSVDSPCHHGQACSCRRPYIGRALVIAVGLELLMGMVAIAAGATAVGLVACGSMAICMWVYVVAEIVAFYRVGLPAPEPESTGPVVVTGRYNQQRHW